jgi:Zn-dependent protease with chaperone function
MSNVYTAAFRSAEGSFMKMSAPLKRQMLKMVAGVVLFFITYCILILVAFALAAACIVGSINLLIRIPDVYFILTLGQVFALTFFGVMIIILIVKFLFIRQKRDNPYRMEITVKDHPLLFDVLYRLAADTKVRFPKKVFLSPWANTAVFYHSSITSMFWPTGKNLEIGLGMVNGLNVSELKMILAHEFGHFSQRSMALGSYLYSFHKVIYHLLYENGGWDRTITRLSKAGALNRFFAQVASYIAKGIRFLLQKMYSLLNKQYMKLSREMELQADAVALFVCGTQNAISALRRSEMSLFSFDDCLYQLKEQADQERKVLNIYDAHRALIRYHAACNNLLLDNEQLPVITDDYFKTFLKGQVQLRNQWATHPSREERELRYLKADIPSVTEHDLAWTLFNNPQQLQEEISAIIYKLEIPESDTCEWMDAEDFIMEVEAKRLIFALPENFHDYYDNRPFPAIDLENLKRLPDEEFDNLSFYSLYTPENTRRIRRYFLNRQDAETLQAIAKGDINIKTFEFQGIQHPSSAAKILIPDLQKAIELDGEWLLQNDLLAFRYHFTLAIRLGDDKAPYLVEQCRQFQLHESHVVWLDAIVAKIMENITYIFGADQISVKKAIPYFEKLSAACRELQAFLDQYTNDNEIAAYWGEPLHTQILDFVFSDCIYMRDHEPLNAEIEHVHAIVSAIPELFYNSLRRKKKELLETMLPTTPW